VFVVTFWWCCRGNQRVFVVVWWMSRGAQGKRKREIHRELHKFNCDRAVITWRASEDCKETLN
jgi:hypothetical protein